MEKRALLAAVVAGLFLVLWYSVFSPAPVQTPAAPIPTAAGAPGEEAKGTSGSEPGEVLEKGPPAAVAGVAAQDVLPEIRGESGGDVRVEGKGWEAVVAREGAELRSLVLREYKDDDGTPLDLVGVVRPLALTAAGPWNTEPYAVEEVGSEIVLRWSDGTGNWVEKRVWPGLGTYGIECVVRAGGAPARGGVVLAGSLAGESEASAGLGRKGGVVRVGGELDRFEAAKVGERRAIDGPVEFVGGEDQYFLLVFLPGSAVRDVALEQTGGTAVRAVAGLGGGEVAGTVFGGPKQHDVLVAYGRGLDATLSFGLFGFFSVMFLGVLRWIHGGVGNWGVAIVLLTAAIRVLLFPLTHKSTVAMRRMQKLKPKMDAIQERYKERAKKDPNVRARMNQEIMSLYKQEGVNPMGGCLPTLVQLPILWALYTLFAYAIELRQAPFALWITDLAVKDPTYILPILMTVSMFLQQKLAPQVGDPAQRRMFMMLPLIFGLMFMNFPSGLVLYWLTNNVLTIGQQVVTERLLKKEARAA